MKKWSLIIGVFLLTLNLFAQEINERNADTANGSLKVITVYEQPNILSVKSKIRKVISDEYTRYYFDINKGKMHSSIQYENLQSLISSIQKLKSQSELDKDNNVDGVKNMIITPKGFVIGYFMSNGKVKHFFSIGGLNSIRDEDIRVLQSIANQVAIALRNARLYADTQQVAGQQLRINEINQKIQQATTVESALQIAVREIGRAVGSGQATVQLADFGVTQLEDADVPDGNGHVSLEDAE